MTFSTDMTLISIVIVDDICCFFLLTPFLYPPKPLLVWAFFMSLKLLGCYGPLLITYQRKTAAVGQA